jgi:hypothetical protein
VGELHGVYFSPWSNNLTHGRGKSTLLKCGDPIHLFGFTRGTQTKHLTPKNPVNCSIVPSKGMAPDPCIHLCMVRYTRYILYVNMFVSYLQLSPQINLSAVFNWNIGKSGIYYHTLQHIMDIRLQRNHF